MRFIFFLLLLLNLLLLGWRVAVGGVAQDLIINEPDAPVDGLSASVAELVLLREMSTPRSSLKVGQVDMAAKSLCKAVGPFDSRGMAENFLARLAALDVQGSVHVVELKSGASHWVFLPPEGDRNTARRRLAELQARGLDSYIIPKGELENGISLGVFSRLDLAQARQAELARVGLETRVQSVDRSYQEVWVMLGAGEEQKIGEKTWKDLVGENISLQEQQNVCLDVASGKNFH